MRGGTAPLCSEEDSRHQPELCRRSRITDISRIFSLVARAEGALSEKVSGEGLDEVSAVITRHELELFPGAGDEAIGLDVVRGRGSVVETSAVDRSEEETTDFCLNNVRTVALGSNQEPGPFQRNAGLSQEGDCILRLVSPVVGRNRLVPSCIDDEIGGINRRTTPFPN